MKRKNTLFRSLFLTNAIFILITVTIAYIIISLETYHFNVSEKGKSRIEVLQQISESNTVSRQGIVNLMDTVYEDFYPLLTAETSEAVNKQIQEELDKTGLQMKNLGIDNIIDILMNDKRIFTLSSSEQSTTSLTNTYWYIKHYSGEIDTSWNFRFSDRSDSKNHGLSYGRTVYDAQNRPIGVIVITADSQVLFRALNEMTEKSTVYILDSNGIIISHSNLNRIGNWGANMSAFETDYGYNSYNIITKNNKSLILSNYHDPDSGWTFVEEQSIDSLLEGTRNMLERSLLFVMAGAVIFIFFAYFRVKKSTNALNRLTSQIAGIGDNELNFVDVDKSYYEISILSETFNDMILKIRELISEIQIREAEKRITEYDFLQAQLDPHFLNNTLVAVRSLLVMSQFERAEKMMEQLVALLHIPANPNIQFIPLREELQLQKNFLDIMDNRTERCTVLQEEIDPIYMDYLVPRMITQPVLGNSVFHGFSEKEDECVIRISAEMDDEDFIIRISDNGNGITPERLEKILSGNYSSDGPHHGIGLANIRSRLKIIFGDEADIMITSELGKGTEVSLRMSNYHAHSRSFNKITPVPNSEPSE